MNRFYSLSIQNDDVYTLAVENRNNIFFVETQQYLKLSELSQFLKNKTSYYVTFAQEEAIDEKILIESVIKNDHVIRKIILEKLFESSAIKKLLFNYHPINGLKNGSKTTYQVDGVYEDEYLHSLKKIDNWSEIKSVTTNKFALLGISCECIKEKSYFSIHTFGNKVIIIVIHDNTLIFSREHTFAIDNPEEREKNLIEEITQTIAYVQQHFREIKFSLIALSGSLCVDDDIFEHIYILSGLGVCVLYPNTFIRGLKNEELHSHMISLGSWFVPKRYQFYPSSILSLNQYNFAIKILLGFSTAAFLITSFFAYKQYDSHSKTLQNHEIAKSRLVQLTQETKIYSNEELSHYLQHLQIAQKYMQHHPIDSLIAIKPLVELQTPQYISWEYFDEFMRLNALFKRSFHTLDALYQFEKLFFHSVQTLSGTLYVTYQNRTNYATLDFETTVTIQNIKQPINSKEIQIPRKRR
jgi:hypothetical protein